MGGGGGLRGRQGLKTAVAAAGGAAALGGLARLWRGAGGGWRLGRRGRSARLRWSSACSVQGLREREGLTIEGAALRLI